jgi:hypothetical protein
VVISQYGTLDFGHPVYQKHRAAETLVTESKVDKYIASLKPGAVRVSTTPARGGYEIMEMIHAEGRLFELIGTDGKLFITTALEKAKNVPPMWIFHGQEDEIVSRSSRQAGERTALMSLGTR